MKFSEIKAEYYTHSGKASDVARQLSYAGFAAIFVFKEGQANGGVPLDLVPAGVFYSLSLLSDLLQYIVHTNSWRSVAKAADKEIIERGKRAAIENTDDETYDVPSRIHRTPEMLYRVKTYAVVAGYTWLVAALVYRLAVWS